MSGIYDVERCPLSYYCTRKWSDLLETNNKSERFCNVCSSTVFLCETEEDFDLRSTEGRCVAYFIKSRDKSDIIGETVGIPKRKNN